MGGQLHRRTEPPFLCVFSPIALVCLSWLFIGVCFADIVTQKANPLSNASSSTSASKFAVESGFPLMNQSINVPNLNSRSVPVRLTKKNPSQRWTGQHLHTCHGCRDVWHNVEDHCKHHPGYANNNRKQLHDHLGRIYSPIWLCSPASCFDSLQL